MAPLHEKSWMRALAHSCNKIFFNPILHGLFQVGSTRSTRGEGGGGERRGTKVLAAFFSETVKTTAIKLDTLTN